MPEREVISWLQHIFWHKKLRGIVLLNSSFDNVKCHSIYLCHGKCQGKYLYQEKWPVLRLSSECKFIRNFIARNYWASFRENLQSMDDLIESSRRFFFYLQVKKYFQNIFKFQRFWRNQRTLDITWTIVFTGAYLCFTYFPLILFWFCPH